MGVQSPLQSQTDTYWKLHKLAQKMRKLVDSFGSESYPPQASSSHRDAKQKLDQLHKQHRALVSEFRAISYELRASGAQDCEHFTKYSRDSDPTEVFPNWAFKYRGPNYTFGELSSDRSSILPDEGKLFTGFWQLFRNLLAPGDDLLAMWPNYFGQSSSSKLLLRSQKEILDELRFPLSGASLEGTISVDLETSSRSPLTGEIIEIGIVEILGNDPLLWPRFSLRFDLSSELAHSIGTGAEYIHGIASEELRGAPKITDSNVQKLLKEYLCSGRRIIAHNASSEFRWLSHYVDGFFEANYDSLGLQTMIDTAVLCKFSRLLFGGPGIDGNSLKAAVQCLGLSYEGAHQAQADAAMTALVAYGMLEPVNNRRLNRLSADEYSRVLEASYMAPVLEVLQRTA